MFAKAVQKSANSDTSGCARISKLQPPADHHILEDEPEEDEDEIEVAIKELYPNVHKVSRATFHTVPEI